MTICEVYNYLQSPITIYTFHNYLYVLYKYLQSPITIYAFHNYLYVLYKYLQSPITIYAFHNYLLYDTIQLLSRQYNYFQD